MPGSPPPKSFALCLAGLLLATACSAEPTSAPSSAPSSSALSSSAAAPVPAAGLAEVTVTVPSNLAEAPFDQPRKALVPNGWTLSVWARMTKPRLAAWTPDGRLLISVPSTGKVVAFGADGTGETVLLDGLDQPHGLAFAGSTLYVAQSDQVDAYDYADGVATRPRTVAPGLPDAKSPDLRGAYSHALKSVVVGPDGAVYFSIGSTGNISVEDRTATPPRATIMRVPPGGGPAEPFATGVRNGTGLAVAPDGAIWIANNGRDNAPDPDGNVREEYVNENPPEQIAKLTPGRELGWPFCNPDGGPANLPFIRDMNTNADGAAMDCATLPAVEQSMGAHSAPLGMSFADLPEPYGAGALIGVHGSWNRQPPRVPEVSFYPWRDGGLGDQQTLVGGFQSEDGSRWGRPVAAVTGPDGAVYITDDYAGAIYRLAPPG
ncbi:PQQ-dependent sugar dehydrogenase [Mycolicibacterium arenosum]|uniref:Gluconolaconase n=1 Tax=Mycolicibacterium arenosum TaxID=2952157 RepID=A0ABT1LZU8_9MYCO|nr:gluconolaconase [Mycolicibacterium sp. CAU 1645]MCP9272425.1 gluconolaconase [Mycolicibacterium sp. CAU 1645]